MRITIKNLTTRHPDRIAKDNRLEYSGGMNFIPHGGTFYETSNWEEHGYAECVRIQESEGTLWVERGTINEPSKTEDLLSALNCCGFTIDNDNDRPGQVRQSGQEPIELTPQIEIESVLAYSGCEVDETATFATDKNDNFDEVAICRVVKQMLLAIIPPNPLPELAEIRSLLIELKKTIGDDYRADGDCDYPSMCVTIGADGKGNWRYQTGDNSYTGGAYGYPHWAVITLDRRSNCADLAHDALYQLADLVS
jgi:hypothetical protein